MGKKAFDPATIRTFALAGHRSTGKTSLSETLLYTTGATRTVGRVDDRSSLLDHHPAERRRGMTLELGFAWLEWDGCLLNLVDTPGSEGLAHKRSVALSGVDGAVVVVSAPDGVEFGTERVLAETADRRLPTLIAVNRCERLEQPARLLEQLGEAAQRRIIPLQLPFHDDEGRFSGVVSLIEPDGELRVLRYDLGGSGRFSPEPVPERYREPAARARETLVERVALGDDELLEQYLEYLELPPDRVLQGLSRLLRRGDAVGVLYTSAQLVIGAEPLLDAVVRLLPSPLDRPAAPARDLDGAPDPVVPDDPFTAQLLATTLDEQGDPVHVLRVWSGEPPRNGAWIEARTGRQSRVHKVYQVRGPRRTVARTLGPGAIVATWDPLPGRPGTTFVTGQRRVMPIAVHDPPMMSYLLTPLTRTDEAALDTALDRLRQLDGALEVRRDALTGGVVLAGLGQMHLEHALELLRGPLGVQVESSLPPVPYRETPSTPVRRAHGLHKRDDRGLVEEYGECWLDVVPRAPNQGLRFESAVEVEQLPDRFWSSIDEGVRQATRHGPTAGYPVVGLGVRCVGGEYDILSSDHEHFVRAGASALRAALNKAGTELLEPWCSVRVEVTTEEVGTVLSEIGSRRGRILDLEVGARTAAIDSQIPFRELRTFAPRLQAVTGGRGRFVATESHYEKLPRELVREAIDASPWRELSTGQPSAYLPGAR